MDRMLRALQAAIAALARPSPSSWPGSRPRRPSGFKPAARRLSGSRCRRTMIRRKLVPRSASRGARGGDASRSANGDPRRPARALLPFRIHPSRTEQAIIRSFPREPRQAERPAAEARKRRASCSSITRVPDHAHRGDPGMFMTPGLAFFYGGLVGERTS